MRYGAQRQQFGPSEGAEIAVLDYLSQQQKLMPMLATCYALHFTSRFLVAQYVEMKRSKNEDLVADVHSLSAGGPCYVASQLGNTQSTTRTARRSMLQRSRGAGHVKWRTGQLRSSHRMQGSLAGRLAGAYRLPPVRAGARQGIAWQGSMSYGMRTLLSPLPAQESL